MMKIKRFKLRETPQLTVDELLSNGFKESENCSYVLEGAKYIKRFDGYRRESNFEYSICIAFKEDLIFDDYTNVLVLDDDFGQPYTPFYNLLDSPDREHNPPALVTVVQDYNKFMSSLTFLEEV